METVLSFRTAPLADTLGHLQESVRRDPCNAESRLALFQVLCVLGQWSRAHAQLAALRELDAEWQIFAHGFDAVLACERVRTEVFAGARTPLVVGEPPGWLGGLVHALKLVARHDWIAAAEQRTRALAEAPGQAGRINDAADFTQIADADARFGPVLEVFVDGKYYWVPFNRLARVDFSGPDMAVDLVWRRAHFTWRSGGESDGFVPVRYPATEHEPDDAARCARVTRWIVAPVETYLGRGQRLLATEEDDYPILDVRRVDFAAPTNGSNGHG